MNYDIANNIAAVAGDIASMAKEAKTPIETMQMSQAALNLANAARTITDIKQAIDRHDR